MDKDTQEIIDEMKSEGLLPEEPKEEPKEDPKEQPTEELSEEKQEQPAEEPAEQPKEEAKPRTPYIPYNKFKEEKTKWQAKEEELQRQIEDLSEKASQISIQPGAKDDDISALAEEYGVDDKLIERIVKIAEKKSQIPSDLLEEIKSFKQDREQQSQFKAFEDEFSGLMKEFPEVATNKERLRELAFTENLSKTPLRYIFLGTDEFRSKEPKKTAESSRGGSDAGNKVIDFEKVKDDPAIISGMSDEEFDKYSSWLAKNTKKLNITSPR